MRTFTIVAATVALLLAPVAAEAKPKKAYGVSAVVSTTTSEVGKAVRVTGKVTGKAAAGKQVSIQRRIGTGPWATVAKAKISKASTYAAKVAMTNGGTISIRAVMPATASAATGVSVARTVTSYRWLSMAKQPSLVFGEVIRDGVATIKGKKYPSSLVVLTGGTVVKTAKTCTRFKATLGFDDASTIPADSAPEFTALFGDVFSGQQPALTRTVSTNQQVEVSANISTMKTFAVVTNSGGADLFPAIGSPQVYCAADALSAMSPSEISSMIP